MLFVKKKKQITQKDSKQRKLKANKKATHEEYERRRRKALFGLRAQSNIHDSKLVLTKGNTWVNSKSNSFAEEKGNTHITTWKEQIIIESESRRKAVFDVLILIFVGYSCFTSVFMVSFNLDEPQQTGYNNAWDYVDEFIETMFIVDLLLNFIQAVKHPDTYEDITDLK